MWEGIVLTALEYIAILFNDCGFDTSRQRSAFMEREFGAKYGKPIHYADELGAADRALLIEILKDVKASNREKARADWSERE